jgi:hypothetical protein
MPKSRNQKFSPFLDCTLHEKLTMKPLEVLSDYFASQKLSEIHNQIDQLVKIALTTDNGKFDEPVDRQRLIEFQDGLTECIDAAFQIAGK